MDLGLTDEQQQLVSSFANLLTKSSPRERVRAAEPKGFDPEVWKALRETGAIEMAVAESDGGWGASMLDLALVGEQIGRALAPAPVIETQVAARLLAAVGSAAAHDVLAAVLAGEQLVTFATRPPRAGVATLTPSGAICDTLLVFDGERLLLAQVTDDRRTFVENLASAPLADVRVDDATELATGPEASACFDAALDEWLALTAAALVGIGAAANEIGCTYAAERRAFGSPIGVFQAVAHPLADDATNLDGARLLAQKAAWALDGGDARARELAASAFAFASTTAASATYNALHVHGGYGFMLEYDVQLYYRRARGWPRVWGDADAAYRRAATARYGATA